MPRTNNSKKGQDLKHDDRNPIFIPTEQALKHGVIVPGNWKFLKTEIIVPEEYLNWITRIQEKGAAYYHLGKYRVVLALAKYNSVYIDTGLPPKEDEIKLIKGDKGYRHNIKKPPTFPKLKIDKPQLETGTYVVSSYMWSTWYALVFLTSGPDFIYLPMSLYEKIEHDKANNMYYYYDKNSNNKMQVTTYCDLKSLRQKHYNFNDDDDSTLLVKEKNSKELDQLLDMLIESGTKDKLSDYNYFIQPITNNISSPNDNNDNNSININNNNNNNNNNNDSRFNDNLDQNPIVPSLPEIKNDNNNVQFRYSRSYEDLTIFQIPDNEGQGFDANILFDNSDDEDSPSKKAKLF